MRRFENRDNVFSAWRKKVQEDWRKGYLRGYHCELSFAEGCWPSFAEERRIRTAPSANRRPSAYQPVSNVATPASRAHTRGFIAMRRRRLTRFFPFYPSTYLTLFWLFFIPSLCPSRISFLSILLYHSLLSKKISYQFSLYPFLHILSFYFLFFFFFTFNFSCLEEQKMFFFFSHQILYKTRRRIFYTKFYYPNKRPAIVFKLFF